MCEQSYFTAEDVAAAKQTINDDGTEFLARVEFIAEKEADVAGFAGIMGLLASGGFGNPVKIKQAISALFVAGVGLGIALSGTSYRVAPFSESEKAEFEKSNAAAVNRVEQFENSIDNALVSAFAREAAAA